MVGRIDRSGVSSPVMAARHIAPDTLQGKELTIIQQFAILRTDFDGDGASVRPINCRYFLPCSEPWARICRTEVRSQDGETRRPAMKLQYGSPWKPAFR